MCGTRGRRWCGSRTRAILKGIAEPSGVASCYRLGLALTLLRSCYVVLLSPGLVAGGCLLGFKGTTLIMFRKPMASCCTCDDFKRARTSTPTHQYSTATPSAEGRP